MKTQNKVRKWKLLIITVWILFLVAASIGCISLQRSTVLQKVRTELTNQSEIISGEFNSLVETNFYSRAVFYDRLIPEIKAVSFVLENYDDIGQAKDFLESVVSTTELKNLWIYDRNGNILFGSGTAPELTPQPADIASVLDSKSYELIEGNYDENDRYWTTTYYLEDDNNGILWGVKDQWLVYARDNLTDELKNVVHFFDWNHTLQDVSVSRGGAVLAVSQTEGVVLSYTDTSARGKQIEDLNIRLAGQKTAATVDQIQKAFPQAGEIAEIEVDSVRYYGTRMNIDNDLFLLLCPSEAVEKEVRISTLILMIPLALITGIGVLYAFCLAAEYRKQLKKSGEKEAVLKASAGRLKLFAILAVVLVLFLSVYLETHFVYSQMFEYTSSTAEDVLQKKTTADGMLKEIKAWYQKGNLEKCKVARCGLQYAAPDKTDRQYVFDLADRLNVSYIFVFDKDGKITVTNAPYDGYVITKDSPLYDLMEGKESVVLQEDQEKTSGEVLEETGVTVIDGDKKVAGAVVIANLTTPVTADGLSFESAFQRTYLKDNAVVLAVDSNNMTVQYFAQVDGSLLVSEQYTFDYNQIDAAELGLDKNLIRDQFNGEMFAVNNEYFASVRRNDNTFLMVLHPLVFIDFANLLSVIFATAAALLFFIGLVWMAGRLGKASAEEAGETDLPEAEQAPAKGPAQVPDEDRAEGEVFALLGKLANREKFDFKTRWPSDGKKWKDKTPMEKFSVAVKLIFITVLVLLLVRVAVAGKDSILYYGLTSEWNTGVNLYTITTCILNIILLFLLREIIHKILFLIAKAATSKGETICHLLNSFLGYILFITAIFIVLGTFGVDVKTLSLTGGIAGVIFGIGCQNIVADILAGIIMVFEGTASVGDFVSYNGRLGVVQSIGVRTTKLRWYSEITMVRNNELKNYVKMLGDETSRITMDLCVDLKEPLTRVEGIIEQELPGIRAALCAKVGENAKLKYRGVQGILDSGKRLSFAIYCDGVYFGRAKRLLNRELLLMCERNEIQLAMPQVVVHEAGAVHPDSDDTAAE